MKRASASTKAAAVDAITKKINVRARYLTQKNYVTIEAASTTEARVVIRGEGIPLEAFKGTRATRAGVSVDVTGNRKVIKHAFEYPGRGGTIIATRSFIGGHRVGRGPIERLFGPAPASVASKQSVRNALRDHFLQRFHIEVVRDLKYRLRTHAQQDADRASSGAKSFFGKSFSSG